MKTYFFGAFSEKGLENKGLAEYKRPSLHNMIYVDGGFKFQDDKEFCMAWGNFYDLPKTAKDLGLDEADDPAELLFKAFKSKGTDGVAEFYGEFTYIVSIADELVVGRDAIGAGLPVYFSEGFFSNNIDNFKKIDGFDFSLDENGLAKFLHLGTPLAPESLIKGIRMLSPGDFLSFKEYKLKTGSIFPYSKYEKLYASRKIDEKEATEELERLHLEAIRRRISNKKSVALLMSGGYDSGGNVAALRGVYDKAINGYSIGFKNDAWSELPLARLLAERFDIDFFDYEIDGSEIDELPQIMSFLGHPFQENGVMVNYCVMKRVQQDQNDVILGGDGNDQIYGTAVQQIALHHLTRKYGMSPFQNILSAMVAGSNNKLLSRVSFHNNRILKCNDYTSFGFTKSEIAKLVKIKPDKFITDALKINNVKTHTFDDLFKAHTYFKDFMHDGNSLIIFKASNMARLFNQHLSFPYMDKDSIEFIYTLPREMRFSGSEKDIAKGKGVGKYLHKKYLEPKLPREITHRKKQGGFAPLSIFFKDEERRTRIYDIIRKSKLYAEIFNKIKLEEFLLQYEKTFTNPDTWFWHQQSMDFRLLNLLVLTVWWNEHFNNKSAQTLQDYL
jgi:asparagine synthase (glutamine-hydrolysing)